MFELCEDYACAAVMNAERSRRNFVLPRYTPGHWFECDVFEITKSGYFCEYEVKLTIADFRADRKKQREKPPYVFGAPRVLENKHDLLAAGATDGPSKFWYVVPAGMITPADLPPWAGLIELTDRGTGYRPSHRWSTREVHAAPKLHRTKLDQKIHDHALGVCYYRFHHAMCALRDRTATPIIWIDEPAEEASA